MVSTFSLFVFYFVYGKILNLYQTLSLFLTTFRLKLKVNLIYKVKIMVQNISSSEVINIILDLFSKGFMFLLPVIGVLAGIHLIYSMVMNVLFRDRL